MKLNRIYIDKIDQWSRKKPLSILGPTGSGKTSTLLNFIRSQSDLQTQSPLLVSLDSITAYKGLDIGSSKPQGKDFEDFSWCGIDIIEPTEQMNATLLRSVVRGPIDQAIQSGRPLIFIGGTHFYERFLLEGAAPGEASDPEFQTELHVLGKEKIFSLLLEKDPRWGQYLHVNDEYRIFRYADLALRQNLDYETLRAGSQNPLFAEVETLVLKMPKEELELKLRKRVDEMFQHGWLSEVCTLLQKYNPDIPALKSMGYLEITKFLQSENRDLNSLKEEILIRHRQLAKQQRTWLRKLRPDKIKSR